MGPSGLDRVRLEATAQVAQARLAEAGVNMVACTWVDNVGVTRVKAIPLSRLARAAAWGVGMSPVHDVFGVDDSITTSEHIGGPVGDLRLHPDLSALSVFAAQPGWALAPVDRWTQDGTRYPADQRGFARRMDSRAAEAGLTLQMGFELEWYLTDAAGEPASQGPAYGMARLIDVAEFARVLVAALETSGVPVEQFHPEYAVSQFELSFSPADPVTAADRVVLVRESVRAIAIRHGLRASFAPVPVAGAVGNGMHLHVSAADATQGNLFAGGPGPVGLTRPGELILASLVARLPALAAIGAPSPASHLRLVPQRWAGAHQCWGVENREAAIRLIRGAIGDRNTAANAELKCVDGSANPYLVVGAVAAVVSAALASELELPEPIGVDPQTMPADQRPSLLPATVDDAMNALGADAELLALLGPELAGAFRSVHRADAARAAGQSAQELTEAVRWRY